MTASIASPYIHVEDSNGNPYVGAQLFVYTVNTTTLLSLYSDRTLSTPLANPLTSNAAGNFPRAYLASGEYKLRAETSTGTLIWEEDYNDTRLGSAGGPLAISAGGTAATSAAAALTSLGAASAASVTALAGDIADILSALQNIVTVPQGYLTATSATPVIASDVASGTSVYYTPDKGNLVPIYDGAAFIIHQFSELTLTLNSNHVASTIYDGFITLDAGVPIIVTGPAWNSSTAGSGSRGSGAGTTELERKNGLWTNKNSMTARNGATTYTIDANEATYVGSLFMDGTNGQITCHRSYGINRKFGIWNAHNQRDITLKGGSLDSSWSYGTDTWRQSNAGGSGTDAKIQIFTGLPDTQFDIQFLQRVDTADATASSAKVGIGINSTTSPSGFNAIVGHNSSASEAWVDTMVATAHFTQQPITGMSNVNLLERATQGTSTFTGAELGSLMTIRYRG